jgi:uncharacterized protein (TIGR02466 family)
MKTDNLFSVPISYGYNKELATSLVSIGAEVLNSKQNIHVRYSELAGENARITLNQTNSRLDKRLKAANNYFCDMCKEYLTIYGYNTDISEERSSLFFNDVGYGGHHPSHIHTNSPVGGVFYVDVDTNSSDLLLTSPNDIMNYTFGKKLVTQTNYNTPQVNFKPENGKFIIFPGWLKHSTAINYTKKRLTLTFVYYYI